MNARLLHDPAIRGWTRYTVNLLAALPACGVELLLYGDRPLDEGHLGRLPTGGWRVRVAPPMRYARWEQWWLPAQCAADRADVLHAPANYGLPWAGRCPAVLTLHDALLHVGSGGRAHSMSLARAALSARVHHWIARTRADHVVTESEHARRDLVDRLGVPADRTSVVQGAADPRFHAPLADDERARVRAAHGLARPFVLYAGGWDARKNVPFLARAFAAADLPGVDLVLAGGGPADGSAGAPDDRVRALGRVSDADLRALYAEALCFVYPSRHEGFGLQLCEAMAAGCPTLAARATSLPEVLGDGGETFGLDDPRELTTWLRRVAADAALRDALSRRARARSAHFSWARAARETVDVYRRVLRRGAHGGG